MCFSEVGQSWVDFQVRHVTGCTLCFSRVELSCVDFQLRHVTGQGLCVFLTGGAVLDRLPAQTCYRSGTVCFSHRWSCPG